MAQGAVATMPVATNGASLTAEELREILEYERIVQFRDAVLAGTHARVKIPLHLAGKQINPTRNFSSPSLPTPPRSNVTASQSARAPILESAASYYNSSPNNQRGSGGSHVSGSSKSEIMPILLEKSDDLIKAEIQLQRQRLERGLREQIEQQRIAAKALLQTSESLPNFDLSEVLSKALAIVHPSTTTEAEISTGASVGAHSTASDSFDENTFYSSQHDTPEGSPAHGQKEPAVLSEGELATDNSALRQVKDREAVMTGTSLSQDNHLAGQAPTQAQHLQQRIHRNLSDQRSDVNHSDSGSQAPATSTPSSGDVQTRKVSPPPRKPVTTTFSSGVEDGGAYANPLVLQSQPEDQLRQALNNATASPLLRVNNLSPFAPQPARVSPLATAREPPVLIEHVGADEAHPAQVSALRNQTTGISSTDSSPKGSKSVDKKKDKKKKKRRGRDMADAPDSPYIKPEPRSPSPYGVAPLPRPQKRQRQSGAYAAELNYDEPRAHPDVEVRERLPDPYTEVRAPRAYERVEERYEPAIRRPEPVYRRMEREDDQYRRVSDVQYIRRAESPGVFAVPHPASEGRPVRAVSHAIVDSRLQEEPRYYREPVMRGSVRPDADRERSRSPRRSPLLMGPPRQAMRLMMDEYGRKFYEAVPAPALRQSVAPPIRYRDSEVIYERAPTRIVSSRLPAETFEEDGVLYRRPSPSLAPVRRVVTQPEYTIPAPPDYRAYRQREYSVRPSPMGPPGEEYIQIRGAPERRQMSHFEEAPREYMQRAPSLRPEAIRYEVPREYVGRAQSVRPGVPPREYTSSVRPEGRREVLPPGQREFSVRPGEGLSRREPVVVSEGERYYDEVPGRRPAEIAYMERPRAREASVVVYADDIRREVYR
jgi:hypothetical protein